ncbi:GAF domain-containing protein [Streptomyces sp. NPDC091217]|uniref:GAF domain-containing protein n=1 Tax=Streptomyces sp. NPDC091217 TaxID=3365975 RepID=UPI0037FC448D
MTEFGDGQSTRLVTDLVESSAEGVIVLDGEGHHLYANATAQRLFEERPDDNLQHILEDDALHVRSWPFTSAGRTFTAVSFHGAGPAERQLRRVAAFARTAARIACRGPLQEVLDRVALEARSATGATACSIILLEPDAFRVRMVGTAGHGEDYVAGLMRSVALGAPLAIVEAFRTGRPARRRHPRELAEKDPRYEPLVAAFGIGGWDEIVAVPAVVQDRCVGVLTSFFPMEDTPRDDDITFLAALADQTATAVDNADLVAELQSAAAEAERHQFAIELHDSVSQALFSVIMQSRALAMRARQAPVSADPAMLQAVTRLESTAEEMQREIRGLLRRIHTEEAHPGDLEEDLSRLVGQLVRSTSTKVRLELPQAGLPPLDGGTRRELTRIVREAVTNSVRHSGASDIVIQVDATAGDLTVGVVDDGVGFDPAQPTPGHLGLESMLYRTTRLGGDLHIESLVPGTAVRVRLPLPPDGSGSDR